MKLRELLKKMEKSQAVMITQEVCVAQCTAGAALDYRINVDLVPDE